MNERRQEQGHGAEVHDVVRTRRFELVDSEGRTRVAITSERDYGDDVPYETPALRFLDPDGHTRISLGFEPASVGLDLSVGGNGAVNLSACDPDPDDPDRPRAYLLLSDGRGVPVFGWHVHSDGSVDMPEPERGSERVLQAHRLDLLDAAGRVRAVLGAEPRGERARAGVIPEHVASGEGYGLTLLDARGSARAMLVTDGASALLSFFNTGGNPAAELGSRDATSPDTGLAGGYLVLCRADGDPVLRWIATPGGELNIDATSAEGEKPGRPPDGNGIS